jgi:hypothetical protein
VEAALKKGRVGRGGWTPFPFGRARLRPELTVSRHSGRVEVRLARPENDDSPVLVIDPSDARRLGRALLRAGLGLSQRVHEYSSVPDLLGKDAESAVEECGMAQLQLIVLDEGSNEAIHDRQEWSNHRVIRQGFPPGTELEVESSVLAWVIRG